MSPPQELMKFLLDAEVNHPANLGSIAAAFEKEMGEGTLKRVAENSMSFWGLHSEK